MCDVEKQQIARRFYLGSARPPTESFAIPLNYDIYILTCVNVNDN